MNASVAILLVLTFVTYSSRAKADEALNNIEAEITHGRIATCQGLLLFKPCIIHSLAKFAVKNENSKPKSSVLFPVAILGSLQDPFNLAMQSIIEPTVEKIRNLDAIMKSLMTTSTNNLESSLQKLNDKMNALKHIASGVLDLLPDQLTTEVQSVVNSIKEQVTLAENTINQLIELSKRAPNASGEIVKTVANSYSDVKLTLSTEFNFDQIAQSISDLDKILAADVSKICKECGGSQSECISKQISTTSSSSRCFTSLLLLVPLMACVLV